MMIAMNHPIRQLAPNAFPPLLQEISDPPATLYLRGTLPTPECKLLTVVGSRKYTPYGKAVVEKLISGLRGYSVAIVSGLALGIDALAHEAALNAGLPTVAVPGSGLNSDVLYPRGNFSLAKRILLAGGGLFSSLQTPF